MALYRKSEFARKCGVSPAKVSVYAKRGKIILSGDYIDDSIRENYEIMEKWVSESQTKNEKSLSGKDSNESSKTQDKKIKTKPTSAPAVSPPEKRIPQPIPIIEDPELNSEDSTLALDKQKKIAEIAFKESQTRLSQLKEDKMRGENIPTEMVLNIISMLGHSFQSSYKNGAHILLMELCHKMKVTVEIEAEFKGKLVDLINKSHKSAVLEAKRSIKTILDDISTSEIDVTEEEG